MMIFQTFTGDGLKRKTIEMKEESTLACLELRLTWVHNIWLLRHDQSGDRIVWGKNRQ